MAESPKVPLGLRDFTGDEDVRESASSFAEVESNTSVIKGLNETKCSPRKNVPQRTSVAPGKVRKSPSMARLGNKKNQLCCPKCKKDDFSNSRELGKHAMKCKISSQADENKRKKKTQAVIPNDRLGRMLHLKRMQKEQEDNMKTKEEQEKIEQEMAVLIKMEKAQEKRDVILKKKREEEAIKKAEEAAKKAEEEKKRELEKLRIIKEKIRQEEIEKEMQERAALLIGDSDTDSDSDADEEAKERRARIEEAIQLKKKLREEEEENQKNQAMENIKKAIKAVNKFQAENNSTKSVEKTTEQTKSTVVPEDEECLRSPYEGYTAAHLAAYNNDPEHLQKIINLGGDLVAPDPEGRTPLHLCALYGHIECLELLLDEQVAQKDNPEFSEETQPTRLVDYMNRTPIFCACYAGDFTAVAWLIEIDPEAALICDSNGDSPVHIASFNNETDCLSMLLQYDADPNSAPNYKGLSPVHQSQEIETIEMLVEYGADYFGFDYNHRSLLFSACANKKPDLVKYLISLDTENVCLEYPDLTGYTPLHAAACSGSTECVRFLLENGANANPKDNNELTPIILASIYGHEEIKTLLSTSGATYEANSELEENLTEAAKSFSASINPETESWSEYYDEDSGYYYYWNNVTGEVTWERPESGTIIPGQ